MASQLANPDHRTFAQQRKAHDQAFWFILQHQGDQGAAVAQVAGSCGPARSSGAE
jgi:hypothetical protein